MSTSAAEFIDYFVANTSAAVNRTDLIKKINIAQNRLLGIDCELMRIQPDPIFVTVLDQYDYVVKDQLRNAQTGAAITADIRCIKTPYARLKWWNWNFGPYIGLRTPLRFVPDELGGYLEAPVTSPRSSGPGNNDCMAYWDLQYQPFDTEDRWYVKTYRWPDQVIEEADLLTIPDDFVYDMLFEYVSALVERPAYGAAPVPDALVAAYQKRLIDAYAAPTTYKRPRNSPAINC